MAGKTKNKKRGSLVFFIIAAVVLLVVIIAVGRNVTKSERHFSGPDPFFPAPVTSISPKPGIKKPAEKIQPEKTGKAGEQQRVIKQMSQRQIERLREDIQTEGPTSRPGKYPTLEELEEIESSGAAFY